MSEVLLYKIYYRLSAFCALFKLGKALRRGKDLCLCLEKAIRITERKFSVILFVNTILGLLALRLRH